jgi:NAD(P)-dependent dehydrogenase (short-subunit alcohol dehydrogenase family)
LEGRTAIVTGAGWGIGRACAVRLAREGASQLLLDINTEAVDEAADACRAAGAPAVVAVAADITDAAAMDGAVALAVETFGGIDILVNCAVYRVVAPFTDITEDEFARSLAVNVTGYFRMAQRVVPHMRARGKGSIVNVTSQLGFVGAPGLSAYSTAKGAQVNMTRVLALELARDGIRVNAVAPGPTDTEGFRAVVRGDASVLEARLADVPMRRLGTPEEIADACLYLASDQSSYVTGHNLVVDGGFLTR